MEKLRIILPMIGFAMIIGVLWVSIKNRRRRVQPKLNQVKQNNTHQPIIDIDEREPTMSDPRLAELGFGGVESVLEDEATCNPTAEPAGEVSAQTATYVRDKFQEPTISQATIPEAKISEPTIKVPQTILLHIMAQRGRHFAGYELLQALLSAGFRYGSMSIFHRHEGMNGKGKTLFSLASAVEPGTFDMASIGGFSCPGLILFMQVDKNKNSAAVFDLMLNTARQLADDLDGHLLDAQRKPLGAQKIDAIQRSLPGRGHRQQQELNLAQQ